MSLLNGNDAACARITSTFVLLLAHWISPLTSRAVGPLSLKRRMRLAPSKEHRVRKNRPTKKSRKSDQESSQSGSVIHRGFVRCTIAT